MDDGEIAIGGVVDPSRGYVAPTVLRNVRSNSAIMKEEIFGPLLPILTFKDIDDAVDFVNERDKPLAIYLFAGDEDVHEFVLESTSSGGICINDTLLQVSLPGLPFGGVGSSGMGAYHGRHGFETFSHRRALVTRSPRFNLGFLYPPYSARMTRWLRRVL
jgi:aldehyde dehydrogenase (NAD+)